MAEERESRTFSVTAVKPFDLDFTMQHPVLAMRTSYTQATQSSIGLRTIMPGAGNSLLDRKQICVKDSYFLTADPSGRFEWVSPHDSSLYRAGTGPVQSRKGRKQSSRYSVEEDIGEDMNMIYPVRAFSITKVEMDGFDPDKEYPVLAIDMDKYLPEEGQEQGDRPEGPQTETMAFFLVGDDNGEFAWVGEDECRLYPLKAQP